MFAHPRPLVCLVPLLALTVALPLSANEPIGRLPIASEAISSLQIAHGKGANVFVAQGEIDFIVPPDGGGVCPSALAINLLQVMRAMTGNDPLPNPHKAVLAAFVKQPELKKGRLTNEAFVKLLAHFADAHLADRATIAVESAANSRHAAGEKQWAKAGPNFDIKPNELKVLSYTVTDGGAWIGRHFVLLKDVRGNEITVLDPARPTKDFRFTIETRMDEGAEWERVILLPPVGLNRAGRTLELNTIFTVRVDDPDAGKKTRLASLGIIKLKIDEMAKSLRGTDRFTSPVLWRRQTADVGLPGLDMPKSLGGSGWSATRTLEVFKYAGRYNLNFRDIVGGAHARLLLKSQSPLAKEVVRRVIAGKAYVAVAMTEPQAGSDFHAMKSVARKVEGGYSLSGEKRYVARLEQATHIVLFARAASGEDRALSAFILPVNTPGLEIVHLKAHGLTGNSFGGLKFDNVMVRDDQLIGEDGKADDLFENHFRYWRLMQCAAALGAGEQALEQMAERLKTRKAFGGAIGRFTHLQQALGQRSTELQMAYSLARDAAELLDSPDADTVKSADVLVNGLKAEGVEIALKAVDDAVRAFGAEGYSDGVDLGDRLRDLNGLRIADGTTDVLRMSVVREKYGRELWNMAVRGSE